MSNSSPRCWRARPAGAYVSSSIVRRHSSPTSGRPQTDIRLKLGMGRDGRITAVEVRVHQRGGAHSGYGVVTILYSGSMLYAIYDLHNVKYIGKRVLTNTPPCGAFRGHGTVDVRFAFESLLDEMAHEFGLDPIAVRRELPQRAHLHRQRSHGERLGLPQCVDWVEKASGWKARNATLRKDEHGRRKGLGFACSHYISGASKPVNWTGEPHATVKIKLDFDGSLVVLWARPTSGRARPRSWRRPSARFSALTSRAHPRCHRQQSEVVPKDNGSYSSRVTFMVGNAAIDAAADKISSRSWWRLRARKLEAKPEEIECLGELYRARSRTRGSPSTKW